MEDIIGLQICNSYGKHRNIVFEFKMNKQLVTNKENQADLKVANEGVSFVV